jgi:tRNA dimethylallyltransferase
LTVADQALILVVGPTAVGKTALAIRLAQRLNTEIVSADSRQVYRELAIGTARPTEAEQAAVRHHLVGTHSVRHPLDAAAYAAEARAVLLRLFEKNNVAVLCGGSGLYIKALLEGLDDLPEIPPQVRADIVRQYRQSGLAWLQAEVKQADAAFFRTVDQQNPHRLIRALELFRVSGKTMNQLRPGARQPLPWRTVKVGLEIPRKVLYQRINRRVDEMMRDGLWQEAAAWIECRHLSSLQTVGYREIFQAIDGTLSPEQAVEQIKQNTRRYAKRQLTWFKRDASVTWFSPDDWHGIVQFVEAGLGC